MIYIEQPDGSEHQFLLTDPRQALRSENPTSIGRNQDAAKVRATAYLCNAYRDANHAVQRILEAIGIDRHGRPRSDVFVVSDHGFAPFHTAVNLTAYLAASGFDPNKVRAVTSGPAVEHLHQPEGARARSDRRAGGVRRAATRSWYGLCVVCSTPTRTTSRQGPCVSSIGAARPVPSDFSDPEFGLGTDAASARTSATCIATLALGYNFDGVQTPAVRDSRCAVNAAPIVLSVPNFYGAHGYDPSLPRDERDLLCGGPAVCGRDDLERVHNIDLAPTILALLDVRRPRPCRAARSISAGAGTDTATATTADPVATGVPRERGGRSGQANAD